MAEFFVMRKYRRRRVGWEAARKLFDRFPGEWWVMQEAENLPAQAFWRRLIGDYTGGMYEEVEQPGGVGPQQIFQSPGKS
jgi:predicted acetyltransferase